MTLDEYQEFTEKTSIYPGAGTPQGLYYSALGLGEAGEIQNKVKKIMRDDQGKLTKERADAIMYELGDLLFYVARIATDLGSVSLSYIAELNKEKLKRRLTEGTIRGDGDGR